MVQTTVCLDGLESSAATLVLKVKDSKKGFVDYIDKEGLALTIKMNIYYVKKLMGKKHLLYRHFEEEEKKRLVEKKTFSIYPNGIVSMVKNIL